MKIFLDSASLNDIKRFSEDARIHGFTTNPSLLKKAGITNYLEFIIEATIASNGKPISFEVISDDESTMELQAKKISKFGNNIYVKIPIINTKGNLMLGLISRLSESEIKVNVTAILTLTNALNVLDSLNNRTPSIISIFAGRIADTGIDPTPIIKTIDAHKKISKNCNNKELLWASPREIINVSQARAANCDIITLPPNLVDKLTLLGRDLDLLTKDTVSMFYNDAMASGLTL